MASQLFGDHHPANWEWVEWRLKPKERTSVKEKVGCGEGWLGRRMMRRSKTILKVHFQGVF